MDMEPRSGLSCRYLRSECDVISGLICKIADDPFCYHQLVRRIFCIDGQELYLVLLIYLSVYGEVTYLAVTVFDLTSRLSDIGHALGTEFVELRIWS